MVKKHKLTTKITAAVVSLCMVVSVFSGVIELLPVSALSRKDYTVVTADDVESLRTLSSNRVQLGTVSAKFTKNGGSTYSNINLSTMQNIADPSHDKATDFSYGLALFNEIKEGYTTNSKDIAAVGTWYTDGSVRRLNITVPLKSATNIKDIVVGSHQHDAVIRTGKFEVFASVNEEDLFSDENSVALIDNTATGLKAKRLIDIQVKNNKLKNRRFVGLSVYQPISTLDPDKYERLVKNNGAGILYPRIVGVSVWGNCASVKLDQDDKTAAIPSDIGEKAYTEATAEMYHKGVKTISEPMIAGKESYKTVDGNAATDPDYMATGSAWRYVTDDQQSAWSTTDAEVRKKFFEDNTDTYTSYTFQIAKNFKPEKLLFIGRSDAGLNTTKYEIYASSKKEELYNEANKIYTYVNDETDAKCRQVYSFDSLDGVDVRYVGFRILIPVMPSTIQYAYRYVVARVPEIGIYGSFARDDVEVEEADEAYALKDDTSVVYGANVYYYDGAQRNPVNISKKSNWFDNDLTTNADGNELSTPFAVAGSNPICFYTDRYADIVYTLKGTATVNKIFVYNHPDPDLMTAEYSLYVGNDLDTLFTDDNKLCVYKNNSQKRAQTFCFPDTTAKYVAMRITKALRTEGYNPQGFAANPVYAYFRLFEFNAYGKQGSDYAPARKLEGEGNYEIPSGTNVLSGMTASVVTVNTETKNAADGCTNVANITDGDIRTECYIGNKGGDLQFATNDLNGNKTWIGNGIEEGTVYSDLTFTFTDKKATVEKLFLAHHTSAGLRTKKFQVYVSNKSDIMELYKAENLVITVENPDAKHSHTIVFDAPIENVKSIGIRVLDPCCTPYWTNANSGHEIYPRFNEIAAIGSTMAAPIDFSEVTRSATDSLPTGVSLEGKTDLVKNKIAPVTTVHEVGANDGEETSWSFLSSTVSNMYDDDLSTQTMLQGARFGKFNTATNTAQYTNTASRGKHTKHSTYLDIYYDLGKEAMLDNIKLAFPDATIWALGRYDVYVGSDLETLYDDENFYVNVDNLSAAHHGQKTRINVICFDENNRPKDCVGRFVGIRVYDPTCTTGRGSGVITADRNHIYSRIHAFQVYGEYTDEDPESLNTIGTLRSATPDDLKSIATGKINLLKTATMYVFNQQGKKINPSEGDKNKVRNVIKNNDGTQTHTDINAEPFHKDGFGLAFKIKEWESAQIEGFAYQGLSQNLQAYWPGTYQLYVSQDIENLWDEGSMFYEFNANVQGRSRAQIIEFADDEMPKGRYVGIKFVDINLQNNISSDYFRLSFMSLWGAAAQVKETSGNIAENMPIDASFINGTEKTKIDENEFTAEEVKNLTDGDKTTYADMDTSAVDRNKVELVYNLCGDNPVDKIAVTALIDSANGFSGMKVYSSPSYAGVFTDEALIWNYAAGSKTGSLTAAKTFSKAKTMRYIRFVFDGVKSKLRLFEIEINGLEDQNLKTRNLSSDWTNDNIRVFRTDKATNERRNKGIHSTLLESLYDGEKSTFIAVNDGAIGDANIDLLIDLGDLRTVNRIDFSFLKRFKNYWPTKLNIYFGKTEAEAFGAASPDYTINTANIDEKVGLWGKNIRPVIAKCMRVEIAEFPTNDSYKNAAGEYLINFVISDIKLTGTGVKDWKASEWVEKSASAASTNSSTQALLAAPVANDNFANALSVNAAAETKRQSDEFKAESNLGFKQESKWLYTGKAKYYLQT